MRNGVRLFNRRRFLSAQQAWEETWRTAEGRQKRNRERDEFLAKLARLRETT